MVTTASGRGVSASVGYADWKRFLRAQGFFHSGFGGLVLGIPAVAIVVVVIAIFVAGVLPQYREPIGLIVVPVLALWLLMVLVFGLVSIARGVRLQRWADGNGVDYVERLVGSGRSPWRGTPFPAHGNYVVRRLLRDDGFTAGRFRSIPRGEGTGNASAIRPFSFVQFALPTRVPHIFVTNRRASVLSWAGIRIAGGTKLGGSTEFDGIFTLHSPKDYERDALYIFTPDLLAALIDYAPDSELELIDNTAFLYLSKEPQLWKPDVADALNSVIDKLSTVLERQTHRYRDERVEQPQTSTSVAAESSLSGLAAAARAADTRVGLGGLRLGQGTSRIAKLVLAFSWVPFAIAIGWFLLDQFGR